MWTILLEHDARPDVGMSVTSYSDLNWDISGEGIRSDEQLFHDNIFHSLCCRLILLGQIAGETIQQEKPDRDYFSEWTTGVFNVDVKVGTQCGKAYLKLLVDEIADHKYTRWGIKAPTKLQWYLQAKRDFGGASICADMKYVGPLATKIYKGVMKNFKFELPVPAIPEIYKYMTFRAGRERVPFTMSVEFFKINLEHGVRSFFGCRVNVNGDVLEDKRKPKILRLYKSMDWSFSLPAAKQA